MTINEAAKLTKFHPGTIRMAILSGKLQAQKVETPSSHYWLITDEDLQTWLDARKR